MQEESRRFIGIDPGKSPALCILDSDGMIIDNLMFKAKNRYPHTEMFYYIEGMRTFDGDIRVVCELPHSVYGASAKSNFTFGYAVGASVQAVEAVDSITTIAPKAWQKVVMEPQDKVKGDTKATALSAAKRILGSKWKDEDFLPTSRSKVVNHNMVDAFLIAYYCYKIYGDNE